MFRAIITSFVVLSVCRFVVADDAYIRRDGQTFTMGTALVERTVALRDGKLLTISVKDKASGREALPNAVPDFSIGLGPKGDRMGGDSGGWKLVDARDARLSQGEQRLDLTIEGHGLRIVRSYMIYPGSSLIREAMAVKNTADAAQIASEPTFLSMAAHVGNPDLLDFHWMTGGENQPGQWTLKTEKLKSDAARTFDSYDPFPGINAGFPGDGIDAKIELNGNQIWPAKGWQYVPNALVTVPFDVKASVKAGDRLVFRVNMHGNIGWDTTTFDPTIAYADGESHTASKEFSNEQGKNGWRYQYIQDGKFVDLVYYPGQAQNWRNKPDNATHTPWVDATSQHPHVNQDSVRVWTAPKDGDVRITGSVCNSGNRSSAAPRGFRPGSSTYAPWYALYGRDTKQGMFVGFDYFGHWSSAFSLGKDGAVGGEIRVAGFRRELKSGESFTTPWGFTGLFHDDLDNAGNELLDWQYAYLWDYTRDGRGSTYPWFPALRTLGYWFKGTGWGKPGVSWTGGNPDLRSTYLKVFRVADYMRFTGTDVYHRDWGWWDVAGDWNGPDFRTTGEYLRKSDMGQLIYAFLYTVDAKSRVAREHPDWLVGGALGGSTLDMSRPEVVAFIEGQLAGFVKNWGDFEWRNDSFFTAERPRDASVLLEQDQGFRRILRDFLDKNPNCAFQAVNGGGNYASYDYIRYASNVQFSDGVVGPLRNYWSSLLFPPDKNCDNPDQWDPDKYDKAKWRGLLCFNYDTTGDTTAPAKLEGIQELNDIYHYLLKEGVVGRWVRVHRPAVEVDDVTFWFERLSRDRRRGVIIPKHVPAGAVTIRPKGLLTAEPYFVSFQESDVTLSMKGNELMEKGIRIEKMPAGELIYLNLPLHPGSKLDKTPPTAPTPIAVKPAENMGFPGVELTWKAGTDDNWISYYDISRDGKLIDKVAKGTYYFDHSAGADAHAKYEVATVDGSGNVSSKAAFVSAQGSRAVVFDDTDGALSYTGKWQRTKQPAAYLGTLTWCKDKDATFEFATEGKRVLIFSKLGADCGKFEVSIDAASPDVVDTFAADDIWGVCVWRHEFPSAGKHAIRMTVLGEHNTLSSGDKVHVDGVRIEQQIVGSR